MGWESVLHPIPVRLPRIRKDAFSAPWRRGRVEAGAYKILRGYRAGRDTLKQLLTLQWLQLQSLP